MAACFLNGCSLLSLVAVVNTPSLPPHLLLPLSRPPFICLSPLLLSLFVFSLHFDSISAPFHFSPSVLSLDCFVVFLKLLALLSFPTLFLLYLCFLCVLIPPSLIYSALPLLLLIPHYFAQSPHVLLLPSSLCIRSLLLLFSIGLSSPVITYRSLCFSSTSLSVFLSSPLASSSSLRLYPHVSPFLPPSPLLSPLPLFLCLLF